MFNFGSSFSNSAWPKSDTFGSKPKHNFHKSPHSPSASDDYETDIDEELGFSPTKSSWRMPKALSSGNHKEMNFPSALSKPSFNSRSIPQEKINPISKDAPWKKVKRVYGTYQEKIQDQLSTNDFIMFHKGNIDIIEEYAKTASKSDLMEKVEAFKKYLPIISNQIGISHDFAELLCSEIIIFDLEETNKADYLAAASVLISSETHLYERQLGNVILNAMIFKPAKRQLLIQFIKELGSEDLRCYVQVQLKKQKRLLNEQEGREKSLIGEPIEIPRFLDTLINELTTSDVKEPNQNTQPTTEKADSTPNSKDEKKDEQKDEVKDDTKDEQKAEVKDEKKDDKIHKGDDQNLEKNGFVLSFKLPSKPSSKQPKITTLPPDPIADGSAPFLINDNVEGLTTYLNSNEKFDVVHAKITLDFDQRNIFPKKEHSHKKFDSIKTDKPTLIEYAAFYGSVKCFNYLLNEKKCKISKHISKHSVCGGNEEIINKILESGKSFEKTLECAIRFHHEALFVRFFDQYKLSSYDKVQTYMKMCLKFANFRIFSFLVKFGGNLNDCIIHESIRRDLISLFLFLYSINGIEIMKLDQNDFTALHYAIRSSNLEVLKLLLSKPNEKVDVNVLGYCGRTPIQLASIVGNMQIFSLLLQQPGVNIKQLDDEDMTALHHAAKQGNRGIVEELLKMHVFDVNCINSALQTPLHYACINGYFRIVEILLKEEGINVNAHDIGGWTPLHYVCENNVISIVKALLAHPDIDPNAVESVCIFKKKFKKY